jgi:hypothetical protein
MSLGLSPICAAGGIAAASSAPPTYVPGRITAPLAGVVYVPGPLAGSAAPAVLQGHPNTPTLQGS